MATQADETLEIVARDLVILRALGEAAEDLANRARADGVSQPVRAALRNQARRANEQAGNLLARGTVDLFNRPPGDAAQQLDQAIAATRGTLERIAKAKQAIEFVGALVGVAGALTGGDWKAVLRQLAALSKKARAVA
ncbi:MAG: hypothetical protein RL456_1455 [Pseudomonadota bacterium]|jgi:hypothetical protein